MEKFLQKLTIKQKMRFGFGVIWVVLAIITIQAAVNLFIVRENVKEVVEVKQPIALQANEMTNALEKSMNALSMYMLTNDPENLRSYAKGIENSEEILAKLNSKVSANQSKEDEEVLDRILNDLSQLPAFVEQVQELQSDRNKKFPAFAFVNQEMMPSAILIQQQIGLMIDSELVDLNSNRKPIIDALLNLQKDWLNVLSGLRGYVAFRNESMAADTENYLNSVEKGLEYLATQSRFELTLEEEDGIERTRAEYEKYRENFMTLKRIHQGPKWRMDTWLMENKIKPLFNSLETDLEHISESSVTQMQDTSQEVVDSTLRNLILLLSLSVFGQLIGMIISRKVTNSVVKPVIRSANAMKDIAYGEGDLTRRLHADGKDELADLARYFNEFISKIQSTLKEVTETVSELEVSSRGLLEVTHETKEGVEQQLEASQRLSRSMITMSEKAKSVEDHSHNTSRATDQAAARVKEGGEVVQGAAQNIRNISEGMEKITQAVMQLNDDSQTISTVINVIREIAEQTNLLALNAAIEAARAGEHGRGFAVVADEVRGLAQRTQESTVQIERVIEKIRKATNETVKVVEVGRDTTQAGYDSVMKVERVLSPVVILMDDINKMSSEMLTSAQSQTALAGEVNEHINQIHGVTERTVEGAANTESSSNRLQQLADKLDRLVHQFKI
ncbi:methyl-accepting chemotaxis protein [Hydrogenovibrio sp. 3SP14C1]|uniref:HAMP domain-containing methyl-accepting chemotaxis protein n=1 Tax=Hydrogenovibrio sp. 3SP14C1 TaxID=3038774 RepID=UPI002416DA09|nr:methyl-accepting chemotaxis protein [Hydrogenovibrio sp. 3SP14C1]MDG4811807.1 methyl-accepting chemotaxis protein [Hydrogenovibrio sp. 3SP14C1]